MDGYHALHDDLSIYHLGVLGLDDESMMDSLWDIFDPEEDG